jgi:uncharacterized protein YndB with AHSA1/START domain
VTDEFRADQTVRLEREYRATPEDLWDAWTAPERLARWLGAPSGPLLGAPGPVRLTLGDGAGEWADVAVTTLDRPRLLELSWEFEGPVRSVLRIELEAVDAAHTRLVVEHRGLGSSTIGYGAGWQAYFDGELAHELGAPAPATHWAERFERALPVWRERAAAAQRTSSATG